MEPIDTVNDMNRKSSVNYDHMSIRYKNKTRKYK